MKWLLVCVITTPRGPSLFQLPNHFLSLLMSGYINLVTYGLEVMLLKYILLHQDGGKRLYLDQMSGCELIKFVTTVVLAIIMTPIIIILIELADVMVSKEQLYINSVALQWNLKQTPVSLCTK